MSSEVKTAHIKSFHYLENNSIDFSILPTVKTTSKLDPGLYSLRYKPYPKDTLELITQSYTESVQLNNFSYKEELYQLIDAFHDVEVRSRLSKLGFSNKIGILLHGKEGTGKSTIIRTLSKHLIDSHKAIVISIPETAYFDKCWELVQKIRQIQTETIVIILDEFDRHVQGQLEAEMKQVLDGNESISNCIFLAATNYIDQIPDTVKNRPSRFKYVFEIGGVTNVNDIEKVLTFMVGDIVAQTEIQSAANELKGETLDKIKQWAMDKIMSLKKVNNTRPKIGFKQ